MNEMVKILKGDEFNTTDWAGGKTTELLIYPKDSKYKEKNFQFRISSATVELDESQFTKLKGINRFITPLDGELKLTHDGKVFTDLKPFDVYEFLGGLETTSYGKAKDFNLMLRDKAKGKLESIKVKDEVSICTGNNVFDIFYSYKGNFKFKINEEEFILNPNELLILNTKKFNKIIDIKVSSQKEDTILRAIVSI